MIEEQNDDSGSVPPVLHKPPCCTLPFSLYNEDCLQTMRRIETGSIDLMLTDPPYGTTSNEWDNNIHLASVWLEWERIIKDDGVLVFTARQPFTSDLIMSRRGFFKYCLVWDKAMCGSFQNAKFMPLQIHEDVVVFSKSNLAKMKFNPQKRKGRMRVKGRPNNKGKETTPNFSGLKDGYFYINDEYFPTSILNFSNAVQINKFHPTQKSEDLFRYLIQTYSNEGDLIFDGYSGSGTTAAACIKEKRRFIGSELNKEYFDLSMKRLKEIMSKPELF